MDFTIAEAKKDNRVIEGKTDLVRKEPIEDKKKDLCSEMGTEDSSRITSSPE